MVNGVQNFDSLETVFFLDLGFVGFGVRFLSLCFCSFNSFVWDSMCFC